MTNPEELAQKYGTKKPSGWKIMISTAGALFAVSHLGLLGYLIDRKAEPPSCLLYTSPSPRDYAASRMPSSA